MCLFDTLNSFLSSLCNYYYHICYSAAKEAKAKEAAAAKEEAAKAKAEADAKKAEEKAAKADAKEKVIA